jgi:hypothetical protein
MPFDESRASPGVPLETDYLQSQMIGKTLEEIEHMRHPYLQEQKMIGWDALAVTIFLLGLLYVRRRKFRRLSASGHGSSAAAWAFAGWAPAMPPRFARRSTDSRPDG